MSFKRCIISFLLVIFSVHLSLAQGVSAQVSAKRVQVGVAFEYAVIITVNATNFVPPNLKDFDIVSGPNQSSSVQYVNGSMSQQLSISYGLVAKREGKFTIGAASIMAGGQKLETSPITIEAVKGSAAASNNQTETQYSNKVSGSDLFIKTSTSKNRCYLGEQITITQKVYSRLQIIGFQKFAQPTYDGFYSQAQESTSKGQLATENIDGINYYTYELFRTIAIANKSGRIILSPVEGDVVIRKQGQAKPKNVFEQFFGTAAYEDIPATVKSRALQVEVMALPEKNKPTNFNGAVGELNCKIQVNRNQLKANEAFNLKLTVSGKGNIKLIDAPKIELPESFETYEPKISEGSNFKTFDYLVIPRSEGEFTLDQLSFSYFNLLKKDYVNIPLEAVKIKVLPPDVTSQGAQVYSAQSQIKQTENDIRYIKKGNFNLTKADVEFFNSFQHISLLLLVLTLLSFAIFLRRNYIKSNSNIVLVKERKAAKVAKKQLQAAEQMMLKNQKDTFYTEVLMALNNYVGHKLNIPVAELSKERIHTTLISKHLALGVLEKLMATINTCEYAKYAPGAVSGDLNAVYKDTVDLIAELEEHLNKKTNEKGV